MSTKERSTVYILFADVDFLVYKMGSENALVATKALGQEHMKGLCKAMQGQNCFIQGCQIFLATKYQNGEK
jgi:hypothetical protein